MTTLLVLLTGFGYVLGTILLAACAAYLASPVIVRLLDSTIPWPADDTDELDALRSEVVELRETVDAARVELLEALAALPVYVPAWQTPPASEYPHGITRAIIRSHPDGSSAGFDAAFARWASTQGLPAPSGRLASSPPLSLPS